MPRLHPAFVLSLLALAFSGCASDDGGPRTGGVDTGRIDQEVLPGEPQAGAAQSGAGGAASEAATGNGEIRGKVQDDAGLPVPGALVSILGTPLSATTNATGAFRFANVSAGAHSVRVAADAVYRIHEGTVEVVAGRVTLVTVTLVPTDGRGPGYRPHLHDYWGTQREIVLVDHDYDLPNTGSYSRYGPVGTAHNAVVVPNGNGNWYWRLPFPERDDNIPPIILPGTAQIKVQLSWGSDTTVQRFQVSYVSAGSTAEARMEPHANGDERVIEVGPGEADNGHQGFSLWQFGVRVVTSPPAVMLDPLHVKLTIVKGDVPPEPAHEDFWNGTDQLTIIDWDTLRTSPGTSVGGCGDTYGNVLPNEGTLVPPGANRMAIRFKGYSDHGAGTAADGTMELRYRPANMPPTTPYEEFVTAEPKESTANSRTYDLPIQASETDAFYQKKSNWLFNAYRTDLNDQCLFSAESFSNWNLEVIVFKDPAFV